MGKSGHYGKNSPQYVFGNLNLDYENPTTSQKGDATNGSAASATQDFDVSQSHFPTTVEQCNTILDGASDNSLPDYDIIRTQLAYLSTDGRGVPVEDNDLSTILTTVNDPDGGATWSPIRKQSPVGGFCYSPYPELSKSIVPPDITTPETLKEFYTENKNFLNQEDHFVGLWNDPETGIVYLDVSVATMDASESREECLSHDQISYFDLQRFESVTVNQNATSGQG